MKTNIINIQFKGVMKHFSLFIILLSLAVASCSRDDSHIIVPSDPESPQGGALIGLNTDRVTNMTFEDTHLYGFNANGTMILHRYYPTQQELSNDLFTMDNGAYTFIAVLNVGEGFTPKPRGELPLLDFTMNQFMSYLKRSESSYPDMLTGMITRTITNNTLERIEIPIADKSGGIITTTTTITATITLPDAEFDEYQKARSRATASYNLRGVVELSQRGDVISREVALLTPTEVLGQYTLTADVFEGEYDITLWVDYTKSNSLVDLWYTTQNLSAIMLIHTDNTYTTDSDSREVFYGTSSVEATGSEASISITTERPQAKYTLVANDLERYRELMKANPDKYGPLSDLSVELIYEGFLPCGFNVVDGIPNDAKTGLKSAKIPLRPVDASDTQVAIGSDYVFVNGTESFVTVTVLVKDNSGRIVSRVQGITINYRRNKLTTITGDFLTAGVINPGIHINTDWDSVHEITF